MPIEIRELVIKTTVQDESTTRLDITRTLDSGKDAIVAECVEKVMELLKEKSER